MSDQEQSISASFIGKEAGLMIFGAAAGLISAGLVGEKAQKPVGIILAVAGIAAAGPEIAKLVDKAVNSRTTKRGSKRTLEGIRNAAGKPALTEDDLNSGLYVG